VASRRKYGCRSTLAMAERATVYNSFTVMNARKGVTKRQDAGARTGKVAPGHGLEP
jgi:hypothetical protein